MCCCTVDLNGKKFFGYLQYLFFCEDSHCSEYSLSIIIVNFFLISIEKDGENQSALIAKSYLSKYRSKGAIF